jgi:glutathione S-transferase
MKLYYVPKTRASRPRWVLEELGVPYELVRLDPSKGETRAAEHLVRQPLGHVPVLEDGPVRLFESAAICLWLAEREGKLLPRPGTPARALTYQWLFYAMTELEPPLIQASAELKKPEGERDAGHLDAATRRFLAAAEPLERVLEGADWILDAFSVVDVVVGACLLWGRSLRILAGLPAVEAYCARIRERPAWKRSIAD